MTEESKHRIEYIPLEAFLEHPANPKGHDLSAIAQSIRDFGFVDPLLIDERTGYIAKGHGRLEALKRLRDSGETAPLRIKVIEGIWHAPAVRGVFFASDRDTLGYLIVDNKLEMTGGWNDDLLKEWGDELGAEEVGLTQADLEQMEEDSDGSIPILPYDEEVDTGNHAGRVGVTTPIWVSFGAWGCLVDRDLVAPVTRRFDQRWGEDPQDSIPAFCEYILELGKRYE